MVKTKNPGEILKGEKEVILADGNTYKVFYSINAIIELQKKYGTLEAVFKEFEKAEKMDFEVFLDFLYVGIKTRNKEIEKEELGDLVDFFNFEELAGAIFGTVKDALPTNDEK